MLLNCQVLQIKVNRVTTVKTLFSGKSTCWFFFGASLRRHVWLSGRGRSQPAGIPGIHDGPSRVSLSLDCAELEPVNQKDRDTGELLYVDLQQRDTDKLALTRRQGWCRCCLAVGGQVFASCGRRTEEGSPSDTGTSFLLGHVHFPPLSTPSDHAGFLSRPRLLLCPCCWFLFLFVSRMWDESSGTPAVCSRRHGLLKVEQNL